MHILQGEAEDVTTAGTGQQGGLFEWVRNLFTHRDGDTDEKAEGKE